MMDLLTFLSGAGGVAIAGGVFKIIEFLLNRRAKDKDDEKAATAATCRARGEELAAIKDALIVILHDRIKQLAKWYIDRGFIDVEEYEDLQRMHKSYHTLGGNGFLDDIMKKVRSLLTRAE